MAIVSNVANLRSSAAGISASRNLEGAPVAPAPGIGAMAQPGGVAPAAGGGVVSVTVGTLEPGAFGARGPLGAAAGRAAPASADDALEQIEAASGTIARASVPYLLGALVSGGLLWYGIKRGSTAASVAGGAGLLLTVPMVLVGGAALMAGASARAA